jgi:hypothetical protein
VEKGGQMRLIRLTDLGGNPVWVMDTWVQVVRHVVTNEARPEARARVVMSGFDEFVRETVDQVVEALGAEGV